MVGRRIALVCALVLAGVPAGVRGQGAEEVARMLVKELSPTGAMEGGQWFTNPESTVGLGIIYAHIPGSAGSVSIHAGLFHRFPTGWSIHRGVEGLFGMSPMDAAFFGDRVEVTTMMLGPDDPRCCPTKQVRWSIDIESGRAVALD